MDISIYRDILKLFEGIPKTVVARESSEEWRNGVERKANRPNYRLAMLLMVRTVPRIAGRA
ncbi:MAG: hypothetical protein E6K07_00250 [Methanobacteriota archaeon]|nr:MAG: hypothetical protein E6K07_00250 [Euryarchaeota archaeon]